MTIRCLLRPLLVLAVSASLSLTMSRGAHAASSCAACPGDLNGDGKVTIDEIVTVVNAALNGCLPSKPCQTAAHLQTGQTQCDQGINIGTLGACPGAYPGQDGSLLKGALRSYTDNGDGTITDNTTGLMWEKLSSDGSIHDYATTYTWYTALPTTGVTTKVATLNSDGFAGHTDWRLPNVNELQSIVDYGTSGPAVDAVFNTNCAASCTVTTCSCTQSSFYWSSTTYQASPTLQFSPTLAWLVGFNDGFVSNDYKSDGYYVRAVRGGS